MSSRDSLITNYIDIAPNEYVTKYSLNRNFEKLLSNDFYLYNKYGINQASESTDIERLKKAQTYNKLKTYDEGEFVFYKIQKDDIKFYILKSKTNANTHKPTVRRDLVTDDLYVVNSDYWTILGIADSKGNSRAKDKADIYIADKQENFDRSHELNTEELSAHPTGKLGMQDSNKMFLTLENISEDRRKFFYPSYLQSFVSDNTVYSGYMRKWDNGLLEYDIVFRLSYISSDNQGIDTLSANNLIVYHRNNNFMYFKNNEDYDIFNRGGNAYVVTNTSKQVNLNPNMNTYSGTIKFIEPFKDLNYMVFTSNFKQVELEAYNVKNEVISDYDKRLIIDGLAVTGTAPSAIFRTHCSIPNEIVNIRNEALAGLEQVDGYPVDIRIDPWQSQLVNIDVNAFSKTQMISIDIPASTRHIAQNAFLGCNQLTAVSFYVNTSNAISNQVKIGKNAFADCKSLLSVFVYRKSAGFSASSSSEMIDNRDLLARLRDPDYRAYIGMPPEDSKIHIESRSAFGNAIQPTLMKASIPQIQDIEIEESQEEDVLQDQNIFTIDANELLAELSATKQQALRSSKKMLFAAIKPTVNVTDVFLTNGTQITGYNSTNLIGDVAFDLAGMPATITEIAEGALDGFNALTSLTCSTRFTSINIGRMQNLDSLTINSDQQCNINIDENNQLSVSLNLISTSSKSFTFNTKSIQSLIIQAKKSAHYSFASKAITADYIQNLMLDGFSTYQASALNCISSIEKCILKSNDNGTILNKDIFFYTIDGDGDIDDTAVNELSLIGNKWMFEENAFKGIIIDHLDIDTTNSILKASSFAMSEIINLKLLNLGAASIENIRTNFSARLKSNCFKNANLVQLEFDGIDFFDGNALGSSISSAEDLTSLGLSAGVMIKDVDSGKFISKVGIDWEYNDIPSYLKYDSNNILTSITLTSWYNVNGENIILPYGTKGIGNRVLDLLNMTTVQKNAVSDLNFIYIPKSVQSIGEYAFRGISALEDLTIESGIQLNEIRTNALSGCTSLRDVVIPA